MSSASDNLAINLTNVTKTYKGKVHALRGIEMRVNRGEVFGLLGPNGAGKSTLVKIMMTVIRPTRAEGTILGQPVGSIASRQGMGYLPENHRFPRYLTGRQTLEFFGALAGVTRAARKKRASELLDTVGMSSWGDRSISTYSKGMMQRVGIAQALMHDPQLVLLDEPTDGVDPVGRREIREVINRMRSEGKTIFVNSHLLSELELICDRVAILLKGSVAKQGTIDELSLARQRYEIELHATPSPELVSSITTALGIPFENTAATATTASTYRGVLAVADHDPIKIDLAGATLLIDSVDAMHAQPLIDRLRAANLPVRRVQLMKPTLEQVFMAAVDEDAAGERVYPGAKLGAA